MAQFERLSAEDFDMGRYQAHSHQIAIEEYAQFLAALEPGEGGEVHLEEGENKSTVRQLLRHAAKRGSVVLGFVPSPPGTVRFRLLEGEPAIVAQSRQRSTVLDTISPKRANGSGNRQKDEMKNRERTTVPDTQKIEEHKELAATIGRLRPTLIAESFEVYMPPTPQKPYTDADEARAAQSAFSAKLRALRHKST